MVKLSTFSVLPKCVKIWWRDFGKKKKNLCRYWVLKYKHTKIHTAFYKYYISLSVSLFGNCSFSLFLSFCRRNRVLASQNPAQFDIVFCVHLLQRSIVHFCLRASRKVLLQNQTRKSLPAYNMFFIYFSQLGKLF